jgi:hypothetical protein
MAAATHAEAVVAPGLCPVTTAELTPDILRAVEEAVRRMLEHEPKQGRHLPKEGGAQGKNR